MCLNVAKKATEYNFVAFNTHTLGCAIITRTGSRSNFNKSLTESAIKNKI